MVKRITWSLLSVALLVEPASALVLDDIQITQISDFAPTATYDSGSETLTWSGGVQTLILGDAGPGFSLATGNIMLEATFGDLGDTSNGGVASASFASGSFTISLIDNLTTVVDISDDIVGAYTEAEVNPQHLLGAAVVELSTATFDNTTGFFDADTGVTVGWEGGAEPENRAGLLSDVTLDLEGSFASYAENYTSFDTVISLVSDEGRVPEPATMLLMGMGAASLMMRRRRS